MLIRLPLLGGIPICSWAGMAVLFLAASVVEAREMREVRGRVVDERGQPVANASVACFWRANGTGRDKNGKPLDLTKEENVRHFWGQLGQMEPAPASAVRTDADGRFVTSIRSIFMTVMAMDESRRFGGLSLVPEDENELVEIRLEPLIEVRGSFERSDSKPCEWTHVYTLLPERESRPLHSTRLVSCGSFDARFKMLLPPGRYYLYSYDDDLTMERNKEIVLTADSPTFDCGVIRLSAGPPNSRTLTERAKASGTWGDYTKLYGKPAPRWHATDARGADKGLQATALKGKWVLVYFWGFNCRPCLQTGLPKLIDFYNEHESQRKHFEVVSICIQKDGDVKSMDEVNRRLAPIIKYAWDGKDIPFPILLDPTFETWRRYGIPGLGVLLVIDPDGNLVEGDESVVAGALSKL